VTTSVDTEGGESAAAIEIADGLEYLDEVRSLIIEYTGRLGRDLAFQHLDEELADLPRKYAQGHGRLLVALVDGKVAACVAYHALNETQAEMKRLYVHPQFRGLHLGQLLGARIVDAARADGYAQMVLDTIKPFKAAIHIYRGLGFEEIPAYYDNPMDDVIYMGRGL
jgi:ribosomal protein S18 acetylase RimI-like enzyme